MIQDRIHIIILISMKYFLIGKKNALIPTPPYRSLIGAVVIRDGLKHMG
jgi:hypothetical protein